MCVFQKLSIVVGVGSIYGGYCWGDLMGYLDCSFLKLARDVLRINLLIVRAPVVKVGGSFSSLRSVC